MRVLFVPPRFVEQPLGLAYVEGEAGALAREVLPVVRVRIVEKLGPVEPVEKLPASEGVFVEPLPVSLGRILGRVRFPVSGEVDPCLVIEGV